MTVGAPWFGAAGQKAVVFVPRFLPSAELHVPPPSPRLLTACAGKVFEPPKGQSKFRLHRSHGGNILTAPGKCLGASELPSRVPGGDAATGRPELLSLGTAGVLVWMVLCWRARGCPVLWDPCFFPPDAHSPRDLRSPDSPCGDVV